MSVRLSLNHFPIRADVKDKCGLPWGCVLQPFQPNGIERLHDLDVSKVARCEKCFAYVNPYVRSLHSGWECSLCQKTNKYSPRYSSRIERRNCMELHHTYVEYDVPDVGGEVKPAVFLAIVDITGQEAGLALVKEGLRAAIHCLPTSAHFGLVTFSEDIGLYDLASARPHVKYLSVPESGKCSLGIDEILAFSRMFVRIETHENNISRAIDSLTSVAPEVTLDADAASRRLKRGFGAALASCVEYLALYKDGVAAARVLSFLCGLPNFGLGSLSENKPDARSPLRSDGKWYKSMGKEAINAGLAVDLFIISSSYVNLPTLYPLATLSGGNLCVYPYATSSTLPQDIYRLYRGPLAARGLLRIRTSHGFKVERCFGHVYPDPSHENLYHLESYDVQCNEWKAVAFDFAFTHASAFDVRRNNVNAVVQVAFSYTRISSRKEEEARGGAIAACRKLRIQTLQVPISRNYGQLYREMDPEAVIALLLQKVLLVARAENLRQARELLSDWLILLLSRCRELQPAPAPGLLPSPAERVGMIFLRYPNIRKIALFVFGLLQSKALDVGVDADTLTYLQCMYSSLDPAAFRRLIYPDVYCFDSPDALVSTNAVGLSLADIIRSGCQIVVLDSYTTMCVYYVQQKGRRGDSRPPADACSGVDLVGQADTSVPLTIGEQFCSSPYHLLPPPKGSLLRNMCMELRQIPHLSPYYVVTKTGIPEETLFLAMLTEDGHGRTPPQNFPQFVNKCSLEAECMSSGE